MNGQKQLPLSLECLVRPSEFPTPTAVYDQNLRQQKWQHRGHSCIVYFRNVFTSYTTFFPIAPLSPFCHQPDKNAFSSSENSMIFLCEMLYKISFSKYLGRFVIIPSYSSEFYWPFIVVHCDFLIPIPWSSSCLWLISVEWSYPHWSSSPRLNVTVRHGTLLTSDPPGIFWHPPLSTCQILRQRHAHSV